MARMIENGPGQSSHRASIRPGSHRGGSMIIEAVISVALLATACYGLVRLARYSAELTHVADAQIAATLTAQNVLDRLSKIESEQLADEAEQVAQAVGRNQGCDVSVAVEPFEDDQIGGQRLDVTVAIDGRATVRLHSWRLESLAVGEESDSGDDSNGGRPTEAESAEEGADD